MVKGVVSFGLALALALAGLLAVPQVAALSENFDLYFLIDESGSIKNNDQNCKKKLTGETCWQLFMDFAEDVINDVANLTEGFRENEDVEGLRTSLTFFDCNKGKPRWKEALPLTGNKSAISNVIQESKSIIPEGGTCPGEALNNIAENVEKNSIDNSGLSIPTAVIVLTDGLFEDGDAAKNAGDKIRASGAEVFALQVGELVKKQSGRGIPKTLKAQKALQKKQLESTAGSEDRVFQVDKASDLETIVDIIAAMFLNKFSFSFGDGTSSYCLGETPPAYITGKSVEFLGLDVSGRSIQCALFQGDGRNLIGYNDGAYTDTSKTQIGCDTTNLFSPLNFGLPSDDVSLTDLYFRFYLKIGDVERQVGEETKLAPISMKRCIEPDEPTTPPCIGDTAAIEFKGRTVAIVHNANKAVKCDLGGSKKVDATVTADTVTCNVDQPAKLANYPFVNLVLGSDLILASAVLKRDMCIESVDLVTGNPTNAQVCWNQQVDVHFAGKSLEWGISNNFDVGCEIDGAKKTKQAGDGGEWRKCADVHPPRPICEIAS